MNQWLKDQLPTLIVGAMVAVILFLLFQKKDSSTDLVNYKIDQLGIDMKQLGKNHDSLIEALSAPVEIDNRKSDSLQQIAIDLNNKTLYELRKKNERRLDTISAAELRSIFAEFSRQHPMPSN